MHSWPLSRYLQTTGEVKLCEVGGPLAALGSEKGLGNSASAFLVRIQDFASLRAAGSGNDTLVIQLHLNPRLWRFG